MPDPGSLKEFGLSGGPVKRRHRRAIVKSVLCIPTSEHAAHSLAPPRELPRSKSSSVLHEKHSDSLRQGSSRKHRTFSLSVLQPPDSERPPAKSSPFALESVSTIDSRRASTSDDIDIGNIQGSVRETDLSAPPCVNGTRGKNSKRSATASFVDPHSQLKRKKSRESCPDGLPERENLRIAEVSCKERRGPADQSLAKRKEGRSISPSDNRRVSKERVSTASHASNAVSLPMKQKIANSEVRRPAAALSGNCATEPNGNAHAVGDVPGPEATIRGKDVLQTSELLVGGRSALRGVGNENDDVIVRRQENAPKEVLRKGVRSDTRRQRKTVSFAESATEIPSELVKPGNSNKTAIDSEFAGSTRKNVDNRSKATLLSPKRASRKTALVDRVKRGEKGLTVLLDDLQYNLDCLFPHGSNGQHEGAQAVALRKILKMFCPENETKGTPKSVEVPEGPLSILLEVLRRRPDQLKMLVTALLEIRRRPAPIPALAMAVLTIIADGVKIAEGFTKENIEPLVEAFYGSCYTSKSHQSDVECENRSGAMKKRGKIERSDSSMRIICDEAREDVCNSLKENSILVSHGLSLKLFEDVTQISSLLAGVVLSKILAESNESRDAMNMQNRMGRISAVFYRTLSNLQELDQTNRGVETLVRKEKDKRIALLGVTMVVFYEASHEEDVKRKIVEQSSVTRRSIQYLNHVVLKGLLHRDAIECFRIHALRLLINIVHGFEKGLNQFVQHGGVQVVLDCLAYAMGMSRSKRGKCDSERNFDVAVLCLALLVSVVDASAHVREILLEVEPTLTVSRAHGGVAFVLELLKVTWDDVHEGDTGKSTSSAEQMERKVITGYLCLLLGALVRQNRKNRMVIRNALPGRTLSGLLPVIDDFLDFHHSAGVNQQDLNAMYRRIMDGLQVEEGLATSEEGCFRL